MRACLSGDERRDYLTKRVREALSEQLRNPCDRHPTKLEAEVALYLFPQARLPTVYIELIGTEGGDRHGRIRRNGIIRSHVFRTQLEFPLFAVAQIRQAVNGQIKIRQYIVVDDIVEKNGIRIENLFREDYAVIERLVATNSPVLLGDLIRILERLRGDRCEPAHKFTKSFSLYFSAI